MGVSSTLLNTIRPESMQLTELHLSVMNGDVEKTRSLLEKGVESEPQDIHGWTPLHHACAMRSFELIQLFNRKSKVRDSLGRTPEDLLAMQSAPRPSRDHLFRYQGKKRKWVDGNDSYFKKKTGYTYTDSIVATSKGLYYQWLNHPLDLLPSELRDEFKQKLSSKRPRLSLHPCDKLGGKYVLTAQSQICRGTVIGEAHGKLVESTEEFERLGRVELNTTQYRNEANFYKDGLPNAFILPPTKDSGYMLIALTEIHKNDPILLCQSQFVPWKFGKYVLFDTKRLTEFFNAHTPSVLFKATCEKPAYTNLKSFYRHTYKSYALFYLFYTPAALLYVVLSDSVSFDELQVLFYDENFQKHLDFEGFPYYSRFLYELFIVLEQRLPTLEKDHFIQQLQRKSVLDVFNELASGVSRVPFFGELEDVEWNTILYSPEVTSETQNPKEILLRCLQGTCKTKNILRTVNGEDSVVYMRLDQLLTVLKESHSNVIPYLSAQLETVSVDEFSCILLLFLLMPENFLASEWNLYAGRFRSWARTLSIAITLLKPDRLDDLRKLLMRTPEPLFSILERGLKLVVRPTTESVYNDFFLGIRIAKKITGEHVELEGKNLSPLNESIYQGRIDEASRLIKNGADITATDYLGWTPLHHAVVSGAMVLFEDLKPLWDVPNSWGATPRDLKTLLEKSALTNSERVGVVVEDGRRKECSSNDFLHITGKFFIHTPYIKAETLRKNWENPGVDINDRQKQAREFQEALLSRWSTTSPPTIELYKTPHGYFTAVDRDIRAGEFISEVVGQMPPLTQEDVPLLGLDPSKKTNFAGAICDGPPNCFFSPFYGERGLPVLYRLTANQDIAAHEPLCYNWVYPSLIKWEKPYRILRKEALFDFFESHSIPSLLKTTSQGVALTDFDSFLVDSAQSSMLFYLMHTPAALAYLLLKKSRHVTPKDVVFVLRSEQHIDLLSLDKQSMHLPLTRTLVDFIPDILKERKEIREFLIAHIEELSMINFITLLRYVGLKKNKENILLDSSLVDGALNLARAAVTVGPEGVDEPALRTVLRSTPKEDHSLIREALFKEQVVMRNEGAKETLRRVFAS